MAHIGQNYKLAFRRDLNQNLPSYRPGWPDQYLLCPSFAPLLPWTMGFVHPWYSSPCTYPNPGRIEWRWPLTFFHGDQYQYVVTMLSPCRPDNGVYATTEMFRNGVSEYLEEHLQPMIGTNANWPPYSRHFFHYNNLPPQQAQDFALSVTTARRWYFP